MAGVGHYHSLRFTGGSGKAKQRQASWNSHFFLDCNGHLPVCGDIYPGLQRSLLLVTDYRAGSNRYRFSRCRCYAGEGRCCSRCNFGRHPMGISGDGVCIALIGAWFAIKMALVVVAILHGVELLEAYSSKFTRGVHVRISEGCNPRRRTIRSSLAADFSCMA